MDIKAQSNLKEVAPMKKICFILPCMVIMLSIMASFAGRDKEQEDKAVVTTKELRIGILSDIHTNTNPVYKPMDRFEKALRFFKEKGVDEVFVTAWGDNGNEASFMCILPVMQQYAEFCYQ